MNLNASISKLLTNRYVLNVVFFVSVLNIIGYIMYQNYDAVMYFVLVGLLVAYFSKNMTIILGVPLILVNFFSIGKKKIFEGLENKVTSEEEAVENTTEFEDVAGIAGVEDVTEGEGEVKGKTAEKFEVGRKKGQYNIDYASTIEDAYDDLNKIIGGDGIKKLTDDSQRLMKQQLQLAEAMKGMGPLIEKMAPMLQGAQSMLKSVGGGGAGPDLSKMVEQMKGAK